jgi:hypothetical protein
MAMKKKTQKKKSCSICNGTEVHKTKRRAFNASGFVIVKEPCICVYPKAEPGIYY